MFLPMNVLQNKRLNEVYVKQLLALNDYSGKNGLILSAEDAKHVIQARANVLTNYGRIELGFNVTEEIISLFQTSGFVNSDNYVNIITGMQEIFYYFKNETNEKVGDKELLNKIKYYFEIECGGSIQLLNSKMESYAKKMRIEQLKLEMEDQGKDIFERKNEKIQKIHLKKNKNMEIVATSQINKKKLSKYNYTVSLMEQALNVGLLTVEEIGTVQVQLFECLSDVIIQKTNGESTSLPVDETKDLMASLVYTLDVCLEQFENPDDAVKLLKNEPIEQLLRQGTEIISNQYDEIKEMYLYIVKNKLDVPLECYHSTIDVAVPTFLKSYSIVFAAQVTATTIDYPLAIDDWDVSGAKYMYTYMKRIILETHFCKIFGDEKVEKLLTYFGKAIHMDYKLELLNIFELVFNNALFMLLAGKMPLNLIFSEEERVDFSKVMMAWSQKEIANIIEKGAEKLIAELGIVDEDTLIYIYRYLPNLVNYAKNAIQNNSLNSIIIAEIKEVEVVKNVIFQSGKAMDSKAFVQLTDAISNIYDADEKAEYIITHIQSLYDFMDILNSDYLYGDEFNVMFSKFSEFELAILAKIVYYEEIRDSSINLKRIIAAMDYFDYEWKEYFAEFLRKLNPDSFSKVEMLIGEVDYEQLKFD